MSQLSGYMFYSMRLSSLSSPSHQLNRLGGTLRNHACGMHSEETGIVGRTLTRYILGSSLGSRRTRDDGLTADGADVHAFYSMRLSSLSSHKNNY